MTSVILQMAALITCGVVWRWANPPGLDADTVRRALTSVVFVLLLPALVLEVLWLAPLTTDTLRISAGALSGTLLALGLAWLIYRGLKTPPFMAGALLLAAAFPNVTYLGLPVLEQTLGSWARSIAIQYDLFATTPLLLTLGIFIARYYGQTEQAEPILPSLLRVPPLWAGVLAVGLNLSNTPVNAGLANLLTMMGSAVVPLMLISLGLALRWEPAQWSRLVIMAPALLIQLLLMPLIVWGITHQLGLQGDTLIGVVLEAAMPCMVIGIVLCDRYGLDTSLYAAMVTLSTLLSLMTLPLWFALLSTAN